MNRSHPGGLGELAEILPQLLRSMDLYQSTTQNIVINRDVHGTIKIYVPMYADVQCEILVQNRGIKTAISWQVQKWITVWSSGLQTIQHPSKSMVEYTLPNDARLYSSETLSGFITGPQTVLKCGTSSGSESKPQPTLPFLNWEEANRRLRKLKELKSQRTWICPELTGVYLCAPWIGAPNKCTKNQDCEVHTGDCSLADDCDCMGDRFRDCDC